MPATKLERRFDRSKIAPLKAERSEGSYADEKSKLVQRQVLPENNFLPPDQTSSDEDSGDDDSDDGADDSSDEEEDVNTPNPFEPVTSTASQGQTSITTSTKTHEHPAPTHSMTSSSSTSPPTSSETGTNVSQGLISTSSPFPGSFTTSSTPSSVVSSTPLAAPASTSPVAASETVSASSHPIAKAAIILPALLGAVAALVAAYLLFRYCTPLKARWAVYRARKGQRLPGEEEDGTAPRAAPQMSEAYTSRTEDQRPPFLPIAAAAVPPTPSVAGDPAIAVPVTTRRAPPPLLVRTGSKSTPANATAADQHARSHSGTQSLHDNTTQPPAYTPEGYGTHAFQLHVQEPDEALFRHPNGLANNPPTPVARNHPPTPVIRGRHEPTSPVPSMPSPASLPLGGGGGGALAMDFPMPPTTPSAAHFSTPSSPPESSFSSPRRLHKSITPSESISNVPDSPFPFSPALRPPMPPPAWDSRWSHNSSSLNGRAAAATAAAALNEEQRGTAPQRHSAGPGLVSSRLSAPPSPASKRKSSSSEVAPPS